MVHRLTLPSGRVLEGFSEVNLASKWADLELGPGWASDPHEEHVTVWSYVEALGLAEEGSLAGHAYEVNDTPELQEGLTSGQG